MAPVVRIFGNTQQQNLAALTLDGVFINSYNKKTRVKTCDALTDEIHTKAQNETKSTEYFVFCRYYIETDICLVRVRIKILYIKMYTHVYRCWYYFLLFFVFFLYLVQRELRENYKRSRRLHTRRTRFEGEYTLACQSYTKQRQPTTHWRGQEIPNDWWNCTRLLGRYLYSSL